MRILSLSALILLSVSVQAAPTLADKPAKWEYAEVTYRNVPSRPAIANADGSETPATPASVTIRWITVTGEAELKGWGEMADKLKMTAFKKDGSVAFQKLQILNQLGSEGWELIDQQVGQPTSTARGPGDGGFGVRTTGVSSSGTWMFKRRVP
ncbi:hypothetical protein [Zavarzinella formosa]|uniref:hypothetical protein n=1 Tax=Zavarzinella formosa TaxID=360055 RepID=UPI0002D7484D|nr:hypothetical protein [Zavarzinella formosa]